MVHHQNKFAFMEILIELSDIESNRQGLFFNLTVISLGVVQKLRCEHSWMFVKAHSMRQNHS